jgi:hypothetical protein
MLEGALPDGLPVPIPDPPEPPSVLLIPVTSPFTIVRLPITELEAVERPVPIPADPLAPLATTEPLTMTRLLQ